MIGWRSDISTKKLLAIFTAICVFRATILAVTAYLEAFQKIADAATSARGKRYYSICFSGNSLVLLLAFLLFIAADRFELHTKVVALSVFKIYIRVLSLLSEFQRVAFFDRGGGYKWVQCPRGRCLDARDFNMGQSMCTNQPFV